MLKSCIGAVSPVVRLCTSHVNFWWIRVGIKYANIFIHLKVWKYSCEALECIRASKFIRRPEYNVVNVHLPLFFRILVQLTGCTFMLGTSINQIAIMSYKNVKRTLIFLILKRHYTTMTYINNKQELSRWILVRAYCMHILFTNSTHTNRLSFNYFQFSFLVKICILQ